MVHIHAMRKLLAVLLTIFVVSLQPDAQAAPKEPQQPGEHVIVSGGVSLWIWEKWKDNPHDNWWMNFVRAARIRIQQIRETDPNAQITWLVYRPSYITRGRQDGRDYINLISSVRDAYNIKLMWFDSTSQFVNYLNFGQPRSQVKISNLEIFAHSNKACIMFDYSNMIDSASKVWLHERDLGQINRGIFTSDALVRSWGCHTGESMSRKFRSATGTPMWGLTGKSQYMTNELPVAASVSGRWVR